MQLWVFSKSGDSRCRHCFLLHHILQQICTVEEVCFVGGVHKAIVQKKSFVGLLAVADSGLQITAAFCSSVAVQASELSKSVTVEVSQST